MAYPVAGALITKSSILTAIEDALITPAVGASVLHSGNVPASAGSTVIHLSANRLGSDAIYMVEYVSKAQTVIDADIIDSILNTALRCTQVRRCGYAVTYNYGDPSEATYPIEQMARLDIQAQQWYEEFNELGRKYLIRYDENIQVGYLFGDTTHATGDRDPDAMGGGLELCATVLEWHRANAPVVDLETCHADCHGNCHSNRTRR